MRFWLAMLVFVLSALTKPAWAAGAAKPLPLGIAVRGLVGSLLVVDGAHVNAGQAILEMDCRPLEQEIKVRAADLNAAEAANERVKNGPRPDEIAIGEANVGVAQARAEEAAATYDRLKALTEGVSVTRAQLLEGRRDARISAAQLNDAKSGSISCMPVRAKRISPKRKLAGTRRRRSLRLPKLSLISARCARLWRGWSNCAPPPDNLSATPCRRRWSF